MVCFTRSGPIEERRLPRRAFPSDEGFFERVAVGSSSRTDVRFLIHCRQCAARPSGNLLDAHDDFHEAASFYQKQNLIATLTEGNYLPDNA